MTITVKALMTLKDVRALGAQLFRQGAMNGSSLRVSKECFAALAREIDALLGEPHKQHPPAVRKADALCVRTVCGVIRVEKLDEP